MKHCFNAMQYASLLIRGNISQRGMFCLPFYEGNRVVFLLQEAANFFPFEFLFFVQCGMQHA